MGRGTKPYFKCKKIDCPFDPRSVGDTGWSAQPNSIFGHADVIAMFELNSTFGHTDVIAMSKLNSIFGHADVRVMS